MSRLSPFKTGLLVIVVIAIACYFAFTQANPFANPYELKAFFHDANSIKTRSPVRIAGVEVGKVTKVEAVEAGSDAARGHDGDRGQGACRSTATRSSRSGRASSSRATSSWTFSPARRPSRSSSPKAPSRPRRPLPPSRSARC